ncbi:ABC-type multidrug transport system fused ATPase/permease subunit [Methylobacterium sp. PvP062]|uniref:ABC-type multidrug transport system fused ATPase/permease subunit n=1 Tax=Methylobacterium radiotolerans TaxID=31998 RepID=A0ABV2N9S6_9HYPH|nr:MULTISPECIES: ABC transporter ATP-binding protein/permease [Methylobacterium]MBP2493517.1 ABC-type multidrug transport system fused ATPase/permease subunit [Methylobacterium sp. PvP105]MBP2500110.1 ABC-type multidrug transport system fused ATPase/permease subunit [Methylobacterium sp. PvP109]UIY43099.1 ABC transporter ATP-binding protein [Methylobacterium radiotolerans]
MESDPLLLTWRAARPQHTVAAALAVGIGAPLCALALLCLRDLIAVLPRDEAPVLPFLRVAVQLPGGELVLVPGMPMRPAELELTAFLCIAVCALALAGVGWFVARLCFKAQNKAGDAVREGVLQAILDAPAGARDEARGLTRIVGEVLARADRLLAAGIVLPAMTLAALILALGFAALAAPRLVPAAVIGLAAIGLAYGLVLERARDRQELRLRSSARAEESLNDLVRRLPAVRNHGAAAIERRRIAARVAAMRTNVGRAEARLAYARAPALALAVILPAIAAGTALWRSGPGQPPAAPVDPAALVAAVGAFGLAGWLAAICARLWMVRRSVRPRLRDLARTIAALEGRRARAARTGSTALPLPRSGILATEGVGAFDPATGERLTGVDVAVSMPGHVAITGSRGSGARALAAVLAGQVEPTAGAVTYAGTDLRDFDAAERARRIAFTSGEAILMEGSLRQNLLYGTDPATAPDDIALIGISRLTGLDGFVYARGLTGRLDPAAQPRLAAAIVTARRTMRVALAAKGAERLVEPFDPDRYNNQASIGENILFGEPVGGTFAPLRFARHPYLRAVLEAEGLVRPLTEIGLSVARSTVEIFADLPNDHPLFDAYSLFQAAERGYFEDLVVRLPSAASLRRGPAGQRDRTRLIGLALRYNESRHRFGLIDGLFEDRLVQARRSFARMLPPHLAGAVVFHDPSRVNPAASLEENLLFGRISLGEANAEPRVRELVRRVLADEGLEASVYGLGLDSKVEIQPSTGALADGAINARERVAIELSRCLARDPDILVVAVAMDERKAEGARERLAQLRQARAGRGLIVCLPETGLAESAAPFDAVIAVENSAVVVPVPADPEREPAPTA